MNTIPPKTRQFLLFCWEEANKVRPYGTHNGMVDKSAELFVERYKKEIFDMKHKWHYYLLIELKHHQNKIGTKIPDEIYEELMPYTFGEEIND